MVKYFLIILILIVASRTNYSQNLEPLEIAKKYLSYNGFAGKEKYLCCEIVDRWGTDSTLGMLIPEAAEKKFELTEQSDNKAVVSVEITDTISSSDTYLYFIKNENWKLEAIRGMAITGLAEMFIKGYEADSSAWYKTMPDSLKKEMQFTYKLSKLEISSDREIIRHFKNHRQVFENLYRYIRKFDSLDEDAFRKFYISDTALINMMHNAVILQIHRLGYIPIGRPDLSGCYFFVIGGVLDNTVGYLYCSDRKYLPEINKDGFIIIKEIEDGWYLYKTT